MSLIEIAYELKLKHGDKVEIYIGDKKITKDEALAHYVCKDTREDAKE